MCREESSDVSFCAGMFVFFAFSLSLCFAAAIDWSLVPVSTNVPFNGAAVANFFPGFVNNPPADGALRGYTIKILADNNYLNLELKGNNGGGTATEIFTNLYFFFPNSPGSDAQKATGFEIGNLFARQFQPGTPNEYSATIPQILRSQTGADGSSTVAVEVRIPWTILLRGSYLVASGNNIGSTLTYNPAAAWQPVVLFLSQSLSYTPVGGTVVLASALVPGFGTE